MAHSPVKDRMTDLTPLLERIVAGDRQAFADVVQQFQRPLSGFLTRMGLSPAQVEELAQDTFVRAWVHLGDYRPERAQFSTWLFTIARRLALNELTRASSQREESTGDATPEPACAGAGPPLALARQRRQRHLREALRTLPTEDRSVLALAYVHELDLTEIARIEGVRPGTVRTRLYRARQRLRDALGPDLESAHEDF